MHSPLLRACGRKSVGCALFIILAFAAAAAQQVTHVIVVPVANMYSSASDDADVVSQAIYGNNIAAVEDKGEWLKVRTADDYTGWIHAGTAKKLADRPYGAGAPAVEVANLSANVYRETDVTKHAPMVTVPFETRLLVMREKVDKNGRWMQVELPDGRTGFVQAGDVLTPKPLSIPETIELAKKFLGVTYTWGGTSSFGYDCSGFTQMLMRHRGVTLPRDADVQAAWSGVAPVERKDLQPGDLLYFGSSAKKITHTGMYIGDGQFIHDTTNTHPMVQISKLDDAPWTRLLVAARRLR